ncbi:hypothetical protein GTW43_20235, partial [Streptomyces sp. SID5785]|nr:hypothetical protein [Streptomyces sp. SID5785]
MVRGQGAAGHRDRSGRRDAPAPGHRPAAPPGPRAPATGRRGPRRLLPAPRRGRRARPAVPRPGGHRTPRPRLARRADRVRRPPGPAPGGRSAGTVPHTRRARPAPLPPRTARPGPGRSPAAAPARRAVQLLRRVRGPAHRQALPPHPARHQPRPRTPPRTGPRGLRPGPGTGRLVRGLRARRRGRTDHPRRPAALRAGGDRRLGARPAPPVHRRRLHRGGPRTGPRHRRGARGPRRRAAHRHPDPGQDRGAGGGDGPAPGRGRPPGAGAAAVRARAARRVRRPDGTGGAGPDLAGPACARGPAPRPVPAGAVRRLAADRLRGRAVPPARRTPSAASAAPRHRRDAPLLRLRRTQSGRRRPRLRPRLPHRVLRGIRGGVRPRPARGSGAAAGVRDGQGGLRGPVRGPAPPDLAPRPTGSPGRLVHPLTGRRPVRGAGNGATRHDARRTRHRQKPPRRAAPKEAPPVTARPTEPPPPLRPAPLSAEDRHRLLTGTHHAPHDVLGAHPAPSGGTALRAWRPHATSVTAHFPDGTSHPLHDDGDGFFSALLDLTDTPDRADSTASAPAHEPREPHALEIAYGGTTLRTPDPYALLPALGELDLHLIAEGRHEQLWKALGAHPMTHQGITGTRFTVWAPNARGVRVVGDFNGWDGAAHTLRSLGSSGVWELFVPGIDEGELYKFDITRPDGTHTLRADPMARHTETPPATASRTHTSHHTWHDDTWMTTRGHRPVHEAPFSVYEIHLPSWRPGLTYRQLAQQLP